MRKISLIALFALGFVLFAQAALCGDHGDDCEFATPIALNSVTDGYLDRGDFDFFYFEIPSTGRLDVYTTGGADTLGYLTDVDGCLSGQAIAEDDDGGSSWNFLMEDIPVNAGDYFVIVRGYDKYSTTGGYKLHLEWTPSGTPEPDGLLAVDVYTNKGGTGPGAGGGSFEIGEAIAIYIRVNKTCTVDMEIRNYDGSLRYSDRFQLNPGIHELPGEIGLPGGARTITVQAYSGYEFAMDTCTYTAIERQDGPALSLDVYTNKGGTGPDTYGGNFEQGEAVAVFIQVNKACTVQLDIQDTNDRLRYQAQYFVSAGAYLINDPAGAYRGRRFVVAQAWTSDETATDTCVYDVGQDVPLGTEPSTGEDGSRGSATVTTNGVSASASSSGSASASASASVGAVVTFGDTETTGETGEDGDEQEGRL